MRENEALRSWLRVIRAYQKSAIVLAELLRPFDLTVPQFDVLAGLYLEDGISQQALAERIFVSKANLSGLLKRLSARRLIERNLSSADGRMNLVYLTGQGRELAEKALKIQQSLIDNSLGKLDKSDIRRLGEIMVRIRKQMEMFSQE